jgi:hypothetical protein
MGPAIPLWAVAIFTFGLSGLALELGAFFGRRRRRLQGGESTEEVGTHSGAMLGLLGFVLAITFGSQLSRFDNYKKLELEEGVVIQATWMRAATLPSPHRERMRDLLKQYVDIRIDMVQAGKTRQAIELSEDLQKEIWAEGIAGTAKMSDDYPNELFLDTLTELITLHERRLAVGKHQRMPAVFWLTLLLLTGLSMAVTGYHGGMTGASRSFVRVIVVLAFSILVMLIADLDRPEDGFLSAKQLPLIDARDRMHE